MQQPNEIVFDIKQFLICQFCLRFIPILLLEFYLVYLYVKEVMKLENSNYDKLDISIFAMSILCLAVNIGSSLIFGIGISSIELILKVVWSFILYLVFLRFIFRRQKSIQYFAISLMILIGYFTISIIFFKTVPIRYTLLAIYLAIISCGFHQWFFINQLLNHQKLRQRELKQTMYNRIKDNQVELLDQRRQYQHRVLSSQVKYHLYLRRSFCTVIGLTLVISYFFIWNLEDSRTSLGQLFVIIVIQILPPLQYYFFACANQWLIQQFNEQERYKQTELQEF